MRNRIAGPNQAIPRKTALAAAALLLASLFRAPPSAAGELVPQWELGAGAAALALPDYRGSDETRGYFLPFPYVIYRLDWMKVDREGVRTKLFDREWADLDVSLSANPPVRSKDNRAREGMSSLRPTVEVGPSLNVRLWRSANDRFRLRLLLPLRAAITVESRPRYAGWVFSPSLNLDVLGVAGTPWRLGMLAGPLFGSRRNHEYYYEVPEYDARPDRPEYHARGGYAGAKFLASLSRRFERIWIGGYARYDTLAGAAFEDSPLVRRRHYAAAGIAAAYVFGQSSKLVERGD